MKSSLPFTRPVYNSCPNAASKQALAQALGLSTGCRDFTDDAHILASVDLSGGQTEAGKRFQPDQHLIGTNLQVYALDFLSKRGSHGSGIV